jgi:hypothetical protein
MIEFNLIILVYDVLHWLNYHDKFLIHREVGWRNREDLSPCDDPCAVCLERSCTVAAEGIPISLPMWGPVHVDMTNFEMKIIFSINFTFVLLSIVYVWWIVNYCRVQSRVLHKMCPLSLLYKQHLCHFIGSTGIHTLPTLPVWHCLIHSTTRGHSHTRPAAIKPLLVSLHHLPSCCSRPGSEPRLGTQLTNPDMWEWLPVHASPIIELSYIPFEQLPEVCDCDTEPGAVYGKP